MGGLRVSDQDFGRGFRLSGTYPEGLPEALGPLSGSFRISHIVGITRGCCVESLV